jgi:putative transposase
MIKQIRTNQKRIGGRKLLNIINPQLPYNNQLGRDAFFDILRRNGMLVRKRRTRPFTTNSYHWLHKYPNLIKDLVIQRPHHLWVSDITYIKTSEGFVYLFLITDAYSRKIVGWHLAETMETRNAISALYMAISQLPADTKEIIHHSDRGIQYCSSKYVSCLQKHDILISMTEHGDPYENAIAERVNGIIKTEWLYDMKLKNHKEALRSIKNIISIYNSERPHSSVDMLTPNNAHSMNGNLKKYWKTYKHKKINTFEV